MLPYCLFSGRERSGYGGRDGFRTAERDGFGYVKVVFIFLKRKSPSILKVPKIFMLYFYLQQSGKQRIWQ